MFDPLYYWTIALGIGLGTFLIRYSFILIMDRITMPDTVHKMLRFIPAAVLPALVVPDVVLNKSDTATFAEPERMIAALVAVGVAWKTKNIFATIGAGMLALWGLQAIL